MENKLEQLLNSLIEKGWKPFGRKKKLHITIYDCDLNVYLDWWFINEDKKSFRELVSKESWLWQFVCENGMVEIDREICWVYSYRFTDVQVCLIRSSLKDESELEDFLLNSIKLD